MLTFLLAAMTLACENAPSGVDARICYSRLATQTDLEMAAQWRITLRKLRQEDAQNRREKKNVPSLADGLLRSQRAWLRYREAQCNMISDQAAGGTGYGEFGNRCEIALNSQRTAQLKQRASGFMSPGFE